MPLRFLLYRLGLSGCLPGWDLRALELICGLMAVGYGWWVVVLDGFASMTALRVFTALAPANIWGAALFGMGALQVTGVLSHWSFASRAGSLLAAGTWVF